MFTHSIPSPELYRDRQGQLTAVINFLQWIWGGRWGEGSRRILTQKLLSRRLFPSLSLCRGDAVIVILGDHAEAWSCPAL